MKGKDIIEGYYMTEAEEGYESSATIKLTVAMSAEQSALFSAISERFDTTRTDLLLPAFKGLSEEMFQGLSQNDRESIGKVADKKATELLLKNGVTIENYPDDLPVNESHYWRRMTSAYNQFEDEKVKEKAKEKVS